MAMNEAYDRTIEAAGNDLAESLRSARDRFEAAWDAHETGGPEPQIEAFLGGLPEGFRGPISSVLEGIDRDRRERRGGEPMAGDRPGSTESEVDFRQASTFDPSKSELGDRLQKTALAPPLPTGDGTEVIPGPSPGPRMGPERFGGTDSTQFQSAGDDEATLDVPHADLALGTTRDGPGTTSQAETLDAPSSRPPGSHAPFRPIAPVGYQLVKELGRGGMGVVYKARQLGLDRDVALKMVLAGAHASPEQLARFRAEAQAIAQLKHPGIVQVFEVGGHDGLPYFALEFIEGGCLADTVRDGPWPPRKAAGLAVQLARAIQAAHDRGIIHRDLKPANVLLTADGTPKITDFGLARRLELDQRQTHTGTILGTPTYMSPEQARGDLQEVGPHSDQYSLGVILYELLTGRPPFQGSSVFDTLEAVRTQEPVSPAQLQPGLPKDLETICLKVLSKEPAKRYEGAGAMADDLERFLRGEPILARPVSRPERLWRWCKRNPRVAGLAAAVALLGIAITGGSVAFAASLKTLNAELAESYRKEEHAKEDAQKNERAAIVAKDEAIAARNAEAEALENERQAREKAEALVAGALEQNGHALEAQRVLSVLLNLRLQAIPGTQAVREELISTTMKGLEATIASMEKLGTVARDKEGFAVATRTLAGINQRAGLIAIEYGKYDETARYFRRMEELSEQLAAAEPDALEPIKVKAAVKATLGDFQIDQIGDTKAAVKYFEQALALRREWQTREPANDQAKRGVANILGALAHALLKLGDPAKARALYREEIELRDQFSPALAEDIEVRREGAGLRSTLGDLSISLGDPAAGRENFELALKLRRKIAADKPDETQAHRDVLLSLEKIGTHELIYTRAPKAALGYYQEALDGFLARLKADESAALAKMDVARVQYYVGTALLRAGDRDAAMNHYRKCRDIREALAKDPKTKINSLDLMLAVGRTGDHARASAIAEGMIKEPPLDARIYFHAACGFALSAEAATSMPPTAGSARLARHYTERSLASLRLALEHGWKSVAEVATDPDLDPIRTDPGFKALLEEFRKAGP
jgi:serine/threonine-protein kinase